MDQRPAPPPEGTLIADALARTGMSIRKASRQAGISYGRWRQITTGYQNISPGVYAPVRAPAGTLARMAQAVGVTPERLAGEGARPDAAEILRNGQDTQYTSAHSHSLTGLTAEERAQAEAFLAAVRAAVSQRESAPRAQNGN